MKILILATQDWAFWSHRLSLARKLRDRGVKVLVMANIDKLGDALKQEGFCAIQWDISRGSLNPFREFVAFLQILRVYRREQPDLVHHVALKPVVYGGLAARHSGKLATIHAITGLGYVFIGRSLQARLLRSGLVMLLRRILNYKNSRIIFQNLGNQKALADAGVISKGQGVIIQGCGVNLKEFTAHPEPVGTPVIMLPGRMLWDKGVAEFVEAARIIREQRLPARFVLVGDPDPANPASIPLSSLQSWTDSGIVEWWGRRTDMPAVLAESNVVCLPSYGEGLAKVLLEAAACGRAIVTTDVPGCREVVQPGENGLVVAPRNASALADAFVTLIKDPSLRARMGSRGRQIAVNEFSEDMKINETLSLYSDLLGATRFPVDPDSSK